MKDQLFILTLILTTILISCSSSREDQEKGDLINGVLKVPRYQKMYTSPITDLPKEILAHLPEEHLVIDTASGDLNNDGFRDMVLVSSYYSNDGELDLRPMFIFFGSGSGYELHGSYLRAILGRNSGGMMPEPFDGLYAQNGFIHIKHYGGSGGNQWSRETMFVLEPQQFVFVLCLDFTQSWQMELDNNFHRSHLFNNERSITLSEFDIHKEQ